MNPTLPNPQSANPAAWPQGAVATAYAAVRAATLEIDAVIDPADTRAWLARALAGARVRERTVGFIDPW